MKSARKNPKPLSRWAVVKQVASHATRLYFAPLVGAVRGARKAELEARREGRDESWRSAGLKG